MTTGETPRLRYDEGCLAAHALNLIGDRWALLVVRELILTPKRFQMLRAGLPGITASVLTARLGQLAGAGVVHHDQRLGLYGLTDLGGALLPVLEALCRWALLAPGHDPTRFISPTALMLSMRVNLMRDAAAGRTMAAGFGFGSEAFELRLADGRLGILPVERPQTPFVLDGDGNTLAAAVYGPVPLAAMAAAGTIAVEGDHAQAQAFVDLFQLAPQG
ncbi:DNA-binding HxlR family transcriptional regulator [Amaricoccus macauensis]|uniref:DNA-binding HxlR family transcriptional regulator n=1 Tax=Amaricoccus macauensis TaxID=57001 RepID=A0A840SR83_9RHOB|nr:helix-turn-helix domain-containing protein [Amaricoccus macauensis]MBB5221732.1 DNA-binding HxlR family transcriptional regulator [Amaricoccus macauensis]